MKHCQKTNCQNLVNFLTVPTQNGKLFYDLNRIRLSFDNQQSTLKKRAVFLDIRPNLITTFRMLRN